jgi:hypothetical protein
MAKRDELKSIPLADSEEVWLAPLEALGRSNMLADWALPPTLPWKSAKADVGPCEEE